MRINDAIPKPSSKKRRRRIGRGISAGQGASGGFGMRGQKSRSGKPTRPGFEGGQMPLYRRLPKLKHFPLVNKKYYTIINLGKLASISPNTVVDFDFLLNEGILTANDGPLKILGDGELNIPLTIKASAFTASAKEKISASGGSWEVVKG
jgi:large subunit ribosomal protein L15